MKDSEPTNDSLSKLIRIIKKYWLILVLFVGVPIILLFGYFYVKISFKYLDYLDRENFKYTLVKSSNEVVGIIDSVYSSHGGTFVTLKDSLKIWFVASENKMYKKHMLFDFVNNNDSLFKRINNDTLFVYRDKKKYYFILGRLNK